MGSRRDWSSLPLASSSELASAAFLDASRWSRRSGRRPRWGYGRLLDWVCPGWACCGAGVWLGWVAAFGNAAGFRLRFRRGGGGRSVWERRAVGDAVGIDDLRHIRERFGGRGVAGVRCGHCRAGWALKCWVLEGEMLGWWSVPGLLLAQWSARPSALRSGFSSPRSRASTASSPCTPGVNRVPAATLRAAARTPPTGAVGGAVGSEQQGGGPHLLGRARKALHQSGSGAGGAGQAQRQGGQVAQHRRQTQVAGRGGGAVRGSCRSRTRRPG